MRRSFFPLLPLLLVVACSSSHPKSAPADAGHDAALDLVGGCSTFTDLRDPSADRTLLWDQSIAVSDDRCIQIKVGQSVTFGNGLGGPGDFTQHPLLAFEGDDNNPIQQLNYTTGTVEFDNPGTFGFQCSTHPPMHGAVLVTVQ